MFYTNNSHSSDGNTLTLQGIRYISETQWEHSPNDSLNANFTDTGVSILGVIEQSNFAYSLERTSDSLPLSALVGTHTNPDDGSTWTMNPDGSFVVNGVCTVTGTVVATKNYYFSADGVKATSCTDPDFESDNYTARLLTVTIQDESYLLAIMANETHALWGSAPITAP